MARGFSRGGRSGGGGGGGFSFGGGGSRSSGGGFRAGFGSSGSSYNRSSDYGRSHYHSGPRPPRRPWRMHFFGRTVILAGPAQTLLSLLIGAFIFSMVFLFGIIGSIGNNKELTKESESMIVKYEEYDKVYASIINNAKSGTEGYYIVDAEFKNIKYTSYGSDPTSTGYYLTDYYQNGEYYYFIVYEFEYHAQDTVGQTKTKPWNDSTFIEFTTYGVKDLGGEIEVAYTYIDGEVWAINTSYTLERNKDYQLEKDYLADLKADNKSNVKMLFIMLAVVGGIVLICVLFIKRKYKQAKKEQAVQDAKNDAEIAEAKARVEIAESKASQVGRTCKYCGADVPDGDSVCPACGSRHFEKD